MTGIDSLCTIRSTFGGGSVGSVRGWGFGEIDLHRDAGGFLMPFCLHVSYTIVCEVGLFSHF